MDKCGGMYELYCTVLVYQGKLDAGMNECNPYLTARIVPSMTNFPGDTTSPSPPDLTSSATKNRFLRALSDDRPGHHQQAPKHYKTRGPTVGTSASAINLQIPNKTQTTPILVLLDQDEILSGYCVLQMRSSRQFSH